MLRTMAFSIGKVSFIMSLIMLLAFFSNILLGNVLSRTEFGEFGLFRTLVLFITPLALWGQDIASARYFSQNDIYRYKWISVYRNVMAGALVFGLTSIFIAHLIYDLEVYKIVFGYFAICLYGSSLFLSSLIRSQQKYNQAMAMYSGFRGLFFVFLLAVHAMGKIDLQTAILAYVAVIALTGLFNNYYALKNLPQGNQSVPSEMHKTGLLLMVINSSVIVMASMDQLFISKLLGPEELGLYLAAIVPTQVFNIVMRASKYVWVPEFGRSKQLRFVSLNIGVALLSVALLGVFLMAPKQILHLLWQGKYDHGVHLLRILAFIGVLRLFYGLGSSVIVGKLGTRAIKCHLWATVGITVLFLYLLYDLIVQYGVMGAGFALLITLGLRVISSYIIIYLHRDEMESKLEIIEETSE